MKSYLPPKWKFLTVMIGLALTWSSVRAQDSGSTTNPLVVVVAPDPIAMEGSSSGAFTLIRYGPTNADLAVDVQLSGTASNGVDYVQIGNVITIPAGSLATDIKVDPLVDQVTRASETVILSIKTNANYRIGEHRWAEVKIMEDVFDFLPPSVTLTSPTDGSSFTNPPSITITANASDPGVQIRSVSFYANDRFLGRATNSPYSLVWSNPPSGRFSLFARAA